MPPLTRLATPSDAADILAIFRPFVEQTTVSFESVTPSVEAYREKIAKVQSAWTWLVLEEHGRIAGYAYGSSHRPSPGYRYSVETTIYLHPEFHGRGLGQGLYTELLERLTAQGYCNAFAGVALPNPASVAVHLRVGFTPVGTYERIGWKFDAWRDVAWFQRQLRDRPLEEG